jgi:hypothetical protein
MIQTNARVNLLGNFFAATEVFDGDDGSEPENRATKLTIEKDRRR